MKKSSVVLVCTTYYSSVTKRKEIQRLHTSFINTGSIQNITISLSVTSHPHLNKYILSKPSKPKRKSLSPDIFRECQHIALEKKEKSPAALN